MSKDEFLQELVEFFLEEFAQDPAGVGDWFAQGDHDIDAFYEMALDLRKRKQT
jgi:hypothetical protein